MQRTGKRIVVKVGTSTLTHENGRLNIQRTEKLVRVLCGLRGAGHEVVLVSSGAIGLGTARLRLPERPRDTRMRQAAAAVGQCELMAAYNRFFLDYGYVTGQILMTRLLTDHGNTRNNLVNTFDTLLSLGVTPVVNENDSVATEELEADYLTFGDNDKLSAIVAGLVKADLLVLLSDIEGLYDENPQQNPNARLIPVVREISDHIRACAGGAGTTRGTGGMQAKLEAAEIATAAGADMVITDGAYPENLYDIVEGKPVGTLFPGKK